MGGFNAAGKDAIALKKYKVESGIHQIQVDFDLFVIDFWDNEIFIVTGNGIAKEVYQYTQS